MSNLFRPIPQEEITSVDIMYGKGKKFFYHNGNRRFRFIVAFNLERYRGAPNAWARRWVVDSIVDQIREAGGRFVEKVEDHFFQVSEKVAREKVSHALREKCPLTTLTDLESSLRRRLSDPNRKTDEYHFIAANERLLRVDLPDSEHATEKAVRNILTTEIQSMFVSASTVSDSLFVIEHPQVSISSPPSARPREATGSKWDNLVYAICSDNIFRRRFSSPDHKTNDMFWIPSEGPREVIPGPVLIQDSDGKRDGLNSSFEPAAVPRNVVLGEDRFFDDIDDEDNDHEDFADWNNDGDLPQDFSADDCEHLVAMLDSVTSFPSLEY